MATIKPRCYIQGSGYKEKVYPSNGDTLDLTDFANIAGLPSQGAAPFLGNVGVVFEDTPPETPSDGDRYVVGVGTGAWDEQDNNIAYYNVDTWEFTTPEEGQFVYEEDSDKYFIFINNSWVVYNGVHGVSSNIEIRTLTGNIELHASRDAQVQVLASNNNNRNIDLIQASAVKGSTFTIYNRSQSSEPSGRYLTVRNGTTNIIRVGQGSYGIFSFNGTDWEALLPMSNYVAIGENSEANNFCSAIGYDAWARGMGTSAIGAGVKVSSNESVALGYGGIITHDNSVGLGRNIMPNGKGRLTLNVASGTVLNQYIIANLGRASSFTSDTYTDLTLASGATNSGSETTLSIRLNSVYRFTADIVGLSANAAHRVSMKISGNVYVGATAGTCELGELEKEVNERTNSDIDAQVIAVTSGTPGIKIQAKSDGTIDMARWHVSVRMVETTFTTS